MERGDKCREGISFFATRIVEASFTEMGDNNILVADFAEVRDTNQGGNS